MIGLAVPGVTTATPISLGPLPPSFGPAPPIAVQPHPPMPTPVLPGPILGPPPPETFHVYPPADTPPSGFSPVIPGRVMPPGGVSYPPFSPGVAQGTPHLRYSSPSRSPEGSVRPSTPSITESGSDVPAQIPPPVVHPSPELPPQMIPPPVQGVSPALPQPSITVVPPVVQISRSPRSPRSPPRESIESFDDRPDQYQPSTMESRVARTPRRSPSPITPVIDVQEPSVRRVSSSDRFDVVQSPVAGPSPSAPPFVIQPPPIAYLPPGPPVATPLPPPPTGDREIHLILDPEESERRTTSPVVLMEGPPLSPVPTMIPPVVPSERFDDGRRPRTPSRERISYVPPPQTSVTVLPHPTPVPPIEIHRTPPPVEQEPIILRTRSTRTPPLYIRTPSGQYARVERSPGRYEHSR